MPRIYPVADGVLKHQLYFQAGTGDGSPVNDCVATFWTWKAGGSPVAGARITAEHAAFWTWISFVGAGRALLPPSWQFTDLRTWDYGLDPAPRTLFTFDPIQGNMSTTGAVPVLTRSVSAVVALRTQPIDSVVRNRLNGRVGWPLVYQSTGSATPVPSFSTVQGAFTTLLASLNGAGSVGKLSVVSWRTGGLIRVTPLVTGVDHVLVQRFGHQRRRDAVPGPYPRGA